MLMAEVFSALVSVKRMKQIDATPEQTGTNVCNNKGYDIEFKNVVFSYNGATKGVSFVAKQGEVTALVGPSGSGKSTASKLAARFWDADSGTITLGGVDVKTVEPETLFKNYAIVPEDVMLFDETVMENIRLGRGDATDEEVMAAARAAQCEDEWGWGRKHGENGSALSGGERQRISIARALLKNAPIVLLDEATASMDAESETLVQDALSVLLKDKTVMVIAHRMRTVANADKIVVLDDGKVSEMGTPAELMAKGGLYAHLVELQGVEKVMEQHWKLKDLGLTIVFSVIYFAVVLAATIMGGISPLSVTALIALVAWIPYIMYGKSAESRRGSHYRTYL